MQTRSFIVHVPIDGQETYFSKVLQRLKKAVIRHVHSGVQQSLSNLGAIQKSGGVPHFFPEVGHRFRKDADVYELEALV